jgi:hypothetical protein
MEPHTSCHRGPNSSKLCLQAQHGCLRRWLRPGKLLPMPNCSFSPGCLNTQSPQGTGFPIPSPHYLRTTPVLTQRTESRGLRLYRPRLVLLPIPHARQVHHEPVVLRRGQQLPARVLWASDAQHGVVRGLRALHPGRVEGEYDGGVREPVLRSGHDFLGVCKLVYGL